eukprot:m.257612 g.257612  ORF g.257612 m.257612 type:complete len:74 (-) comp16191_c1_seq1:108-329(-)
MYLQQKQQDRPLLHYSWDIKTSTANLFKNKHLATRQRPMKRHSCSMFQTVFSCKKEATFGGVGQNREKGCLFD